MVEMITHCPACGCEIVVDNVTRSHVDYEACVQALLQEEDSVSQRQRIRRLVKLIFKKLRDCEKVKKV